MSALGWWLAEAVLGGAARVEGSLRPLLRDRPHRIALAGVLLLAAIARIGMAGEGLPYLHQWDEPYTVWRAQDVLLTGELNAHHYHYGSLLLYLNVLLFVVHTWFLFSRPDSVPNHLGSLDELIVGRYPDFWTTSHPSYYLWSRCMVAAMGVATVALTYQLGRSLGGRWAGVAAAALLAAAPVHVQYSAMVVNDAPATFLIAAVMALSVRYAREAAPSLLAWACLLVGFTASTKYNMGAVWIAPIAALAQVGLQGHPRYRHDLWVLVAALPIVGFLITTPFAITELRLFLDQSGIEVRHYLVYGHGQKYSSYDPWGQLWTQTREIAWNTGLVPLLIAPLGLLRLRRADAVPLLAFPLVYGTLMAGSIVGFHRNWLPLYPVIAVLFGLGLTVVIGWTRRRRLAIGVTAAALLAGMVAQDARGIATWRHRETRTVAIEAVDRVAAEQRWAEIGIAAELQVHPFDLARLRVPYVVLPLDALLCTARPTVIVLGTEHASHKSSHNHDVGYQKVLEADLAELELGAEVLRVEGDETPWGAPVIEPGVRVVQRGAVPEAACARWAAARALLDEARGEPVNGAE